MVLPMSTLPYSLYRAENVRALDRAAIDEFNIPGIDLMNRAGDAVFQRVRRRWPEAKRLVVLCGGGNNSGDGYVIARLALAAGLAPIVLAVSAPEKLSGDAALARDAAAKAGVVFETDVAALLEGADLIVDALFGTGLDRDIGGVYAEVIERVNAQTAPVVAVDIPSGLHADTGQVMACAIRAALTVTFIGLKQGLLSADGPEQCGELVFDGLCVPAPVYAQVPSASQRMDWAGTHLFSARHRNAHKGSHGHALLIGGNEGMGGAVRMAGEAVARCGAGLVSVATRQQHVAALMAARPEVMWHGVENIDQFAPLLARASVLAIGPGLGQCNWAQALFDQVLANDLPMVIDADALHLLVQKNLNQHRWVLTPHPGEAARMLNCTTEQINANRFESVRELQRRYGGVVVLKGAGSLVCDEGGDISLCSDGNPGMATGGMGDVLTGVITALIAQGATLAEAAKAGVCLHAAAADRAVAVEGERGLLATDLMPHLRRLLNMPKSAAMAGALLKH